MHANEITDDVLMNRLKNSDSLAFETIYHRYWRQLFVFVYQQIGCKEEAKEVLQDLMLSLWQKRGDSNIHNLRAYLFIAARNLVNMYYRREINVRKYQEFQVMWEVMGNIDTDHIIYERELLEAIEKVLEKLPEKTASIFRMNKLDHVSVNRIAAQLELSDKAVEYHLTKSMKVMRKQLQRYFLSN